MKDYIKIINPCTMWVIVAIGILIIMSLVPKVIIFSPNLYGFVIFILCMIYWLYFFFSSLRAHKEIIYASSSITHIIKTGIYSKVRHPVYSGDIVLFIGIFFLYPSVGLLIGVLFTIFVLIFWMNLEEMVLIKKFGKEYQEYKKKTPMIIPRFV